MVVFTVLFDNYSTDSTLHSNWGFACLVEVSGRSVLFDTGSDGDALFYNIRKLGIDITAIEAVVISHNHWDHVGGLGDVLDNIPGVRLYIPQSFPERFKNAARNQGAEVIGITGPLEVIPGILSLGEMGDNIIEQSLLVITEEGNVLLTGCAHTGVLDIINNAAEYTGSPPYMVLGGLHLKGKSERILREIAEGVREQGVKRAAPSHCTGDRGREIFADAFGADYIEIGAGSIIDGFSGSRLRGRSFT
jgi:7,8-dihydropterin-6-yl-methyl-4-(beta-D-ribofuranosyl)aminobenzene 5'-phosphate synthase